MKGSGNTGLQDLLRRIAGRGGRSTKARSTMQPLPAYGNNEVEYLRASSSDEIQLVAYRVSAGGPVASPKRRWMDDTENRFANRCLPLLIGNLAGWFVVNDRKIEVLWNGGNAISDFTIRYYKHNWTTDTLR